MSKALFPQFHIPFDKLRERPSTSSGSGISSFPIDSVAELAEAQAQGAGLRIFEGQHIKHLKNKIVDFLSGCTLEYNKYITST